MNLNCLNIFGTTWWLRQPQNIYADLSFFTRKKTSICSFEWMCVVLPLFQIIIRLTFLAPNLTTQRIKNFVQKYTDKIKRCIYSSTFNDKNKSQQNKRYLHRAFSAYAAKFPRNLASFHVLGKPKRIKKMNSQSNTSIFLLGILHDVRYELYG